MKNVYIEKEDLSKVKFYEDGIGVPSGTVYVRNAAARQSLIDAGLEASKISENYTWVAPQ